MKQRHLAPKLIEALGDTPAVLLIGARQVGKSTLVQAIASRRSRARVLTLDDAVVRSAAADDPQGFVAEIEGPVVLDEVQRVPELFIAIKAAIDRDRSPGRFLLTGSANVMFLPSLAHELTGRMEVFELHPFSQGEIEGRVDRFVDRVFATTFHPGDADVDSSSLKGRALRGGYPEAVARAGAQRREAWFAAYLTTLLQREVRELAQVERLFDLPRLCRLIAVRSGGLHNASELARSLGFAQTTLRRYLGLLEATFVIRRVPAWSANLSKRLVRSPKLYLSDSGLLSHLAGYTDDRLRWQPDAWGSLLETFVVGELHKQVGWSSIRPSIFHFRTHSGTEVDVVLEDASGRLVGVEIKAKESVSSGHFRSLRKLRAAVPDRFVRGVLLYGGREVVPFGPDLVAVPACDVWG